MKKEVSNKITMYNFFMTIGIVLYHFWIEYNPKSTHWSMPILRFFYKLCNKGIGKLAMGMFFMMSGFLLYSGANTVGDVLKKIKRRLRTLIIPFIIWNTFMLIYSFAVGLITPFISFKTFILGYIFSPFNGPLWYLLALSLLMLFAPIVIKLKNNKKMSILVLIIVAMASRLIPISGSGIYKTITDNVWYIGNILAYLPLYAIGAFLGMHYSTMILEENYNARKIRRIAVPIFLVSLIAICFSSSIAIFVICVISCWLSIESGVFSKNPARCFRISFFVYVLHSPFLIDIVSTAIRFINGDVLKFLLPIEIVFWRIVGTLFIWGIAIIIERILKLILPIRVYGMLTGDRVKSRNMK